LLEIIQLPSCKKCFQQKKGDISKNLAEDLKEKHCFVSMDYKKAIENPGEYNIVENIDGVEININRERFVTPEILFNPSVINNQSPGIADLIREVANSLDPDLSLEMRSNIVLSGGSTMFKNFSERLQKELGYSYIVIAANDRDQAVFNGAYKFKKSMTKETYPTLSIIKEEYDRYGPTTIGKYHMVHPCH